MKWEIEGAKVTAWINENQYYCTDKIGNGVFFVDLSRNDRHQITGTCQFSVRGLKQESKKSKLRRWIAEREDAR